MVLLCKAHNIPEGCYFSEYHSDNTVKKIIHNPNKNALIFKYFKNLKLIPLKESNEEIHKHETDTYFSYTFKFDLPSNYTLFIDEIWLDNLKIISIRSDKPKFHNGYYKILDSKFDYTYVNNLIINSEN